MEDNTISQIIQAGIDVGSVSAKMVALVPATFNDLVKSLLNSEFYKEYGTDYQGRYIYVSRSVKVQGEPIRAVNLLLNNWGIDLPLSIQVTGSQAKRIAALIKCPHVNDFKAIGRGTAEIVPDVRTIIEIGGDISRYIRVKYEKNSQKLSILDYDKNGDCAAGTGSFIDQQAERLKYTIDEIGPLVMTAENSANIAGRCSVFAKSDMIHAQQRGFSPAAIFKGLCEAVVRNYKGTVLRGKELEKKIVFVGGVAANRGVVQAMYDIFGFQASDLIIPGLYANMGALGCAVLDGGAIVSLAQVKEMLHHHNNTDKEFPQSPKLLVSRVRFENESLNYPDPAAIKNLPVYLGLDIGSVSTNLVLMDESGNVIDDVYTRTEGKPVQVVQRELLAWKNKWADRVIIKGVGATGSGRELVGELVGADSVNDEITAHKTGADTIAQKLFNEKVDTIFEIGGQDSKFISIKDGIVVDFTMNEACAAGTGSFLEEQAGKLGISIKDQFADLAIGSDMPIKMGERCTVFMEKDVTAFLQQGLSKSDVAAGLAYAVVHNYLNRVVRGRKIGERIYFQGGTAFNKAVAAAFSLVLDKEIVVPPHNGVMGAIGAALLAQEKVTALAIKTRFRGFDLSKVNYTIRNIRCKGCTNNCDVQECTVEGEKTYWGDKCSDRYRKKTKIKTRTDFPDLLKLYEELLVKNIPGPDGLGVKVGFPRSLYFYDRFPFWRTYFAHLGAEVVITDTTSKRIAKKGRDLCIAEPCFPVVAGHGHFAEMLDMGVDYIFAPNIVSSETPFPDKESWYCPWGQTLPYVIKNSLTDQRAVDKMLIPVIRFRNGRDYIKKSLHSVALRLGASTKKSDLAVDFAYAEQQLFTNTLKQAGLDALAFLEQKKQKAIVIIGRPYNVYDPGVNLNVPAKLRDDYGINLLTIDYLPVDAIDVSKYHQNMFWNYGRKIMQTAIFVGQHKNLDAIYFTNFKCGPDSYIKHFVGECIGSPYLTLQFDDHSNDAGVMTRCEAFLASKKLLKLQNFSDKSEMMKNMQNLGGHE